MDNINKSEIKEPEKAKVREMNDDDLDTVSGGQFPDPAPIVYPEGAPNDPNRAPF